MLVGPLDMRIQHARIREALIALRTGARLLARMRALVVTHRHDARKLSGAEAARERLVALVDDQPVLL